MRRAAGSIAVIARVATAVLTAAGALAACGDDGPTAVAAFPADYASTYVEVRGCRTSADHDLRRIRVLADPAALAPYRDRLADFPAGAILLKEELDFGDTTCGEPPVQWTVMQRLAAGDPADPRQLGWRWQRVDPDRSVVTEDEPRCFGCHADCGAPPDGYRGTCAIP